MKFESKLIIFISILTLFILIGGIILLSKNQSQTQQIQEQTYQIDYSKGDKIGSDSAKVRLVEFSDYECPACALYAPTVSALVASNLSNLQFIYRHFPLPQHPLARQASTVAKSAGAQGKFWPMHEKLFATQGDWSALESPTDYFLKLAKDLNLDDKKIQSDLNQDSFKDIINQDLSEGYSLNINSTPTFFLNGKKLSPTSLDDLQNKVNQALQNP